MAAHSYWRLNISANNGDTAYIQFAELQFRATVGGADQCSGGTAIGSSAYSTTPFSQAFDDNTTTTWATDTNVLSGWIGYAFAAPVEVLEYVVIAQSATLARSPKEWTLDYSDDGVTWTVLNALDGQTGWTASQIRTFAVADPAFTQVRVSQVPVEVIRANLAAELQVSQVAVEVIRPYIRTAFVTQVVEEVLRTNLAPAARASQVVQEVLRTNLGAAAINTQLVMEVLRPNAAEVVLSNARPQVFVCT